jgi:hypothetical protein
MVQAILGPNYDKRKRPKLDGFIAAANEVTNFCKLLSQKKGRVVRMGGLQESTLLQIETFMAAHFYQLSDPDYTSRSTEGASGSFKRGTTDQGFALTDYGRNAMDIDWSGCLKNVNKQQFAGGLHMGNWERWWNGPCVGTAN